MDNPEKKANKVKIKKNKKVSNLTTENNKDISILQPNGQDSTKIEEKQEQEKDEVQIFKDLNIYVEIVNNNRDQSDIMDHVLIKQGANVSKNFNLNQISKKLIKNLNYIVFKDGKLKTIEYALKHSIKIVNPLWVYDSNLSNSLLEDEKYLVKKTFSETSVQKNINNLDKAKKQQQQILNNNNKRTHQEMVDSTISSIKEPENDLIKPKKKLLDDSKNNKTAEIISKSSTPVTKITENQASSLSTGVTKPKIALESSKHKTSINLKQKEDSEDDNKRTPKITNFFKKQSLSYSSQEEQNTTPNGNSNIKMKSKTNSEINEIQIDKYKISSIFINEIEKHKILKCCKNFGNFKYIGDNLKQVSESDFVIVGKNFNKNDTRIVYCVLNKLKLIKLSYFTDSLENKKYLNIEDYLINIRDISFVKSDYQTNEEESKAQLFEKDCIKIYLHPSLFDYEKTNDLKKETLIQCIKYLSKDDTIVDNIRLATMCIINKYDPSDYFPGHVKLVNQNYIYDCFYFNKLCDSEDLKYNAEVIKSK